MIFTSLASSSAGNAYVVDDGESRILLECGLPYKRLQKLLGFETSGLAACLISHEHKDHSKCWADLLKNGVKVYASLGTAEALGSELIEPLPVNVNFEYIPFRAGSFTVLPFPTFHDAAEPVGYLLLGADGDELFFATDTVNLRYQLPTVNLLAVECNYAYDILDRCTKLPEKVCHRITNSHMELGRLCGWLSGLELKHCRELYLMHLSDSCSNEGRFVDEVERCVPRHVKVRACPKEGGAARKEDGAT